MNIDKQLFVDQERAHIERMADSMAVYREAVALYFGSHPTEYGSISNERLEELGALPEWYVLPSAAYAWDWVNYRDTNGLIYVFASSKPSFNMAVAVAKLSRDSMLAGHYRNNDTTLFTIRHGKTKIPIPEVIRPVIPHGSPVWIAHPK